MDDRLNQAAACRCKRSLLFAIAISFGVESRADQAWYMQEVQEPAPAGTFAVEAPPVHASRFIHEPVETQTLPWETVAEASLTATLRPPVPATIPTPASTKPANTKPANTKAANAASTIATPRVIKQPSTPTLSVPAPTPAVSTPSSISAPTPTPSPEWAPTPRPTNRKRKIARDALVVDVASLEVIEDGAEETLSTAHWKDAPAAVVMPGISIAALRQSAVRSMTEADNRLTHRASLSATAAATQALRLITQSIDLTQGNGTASKQLDVALTAIREADDFVGRYGTVDAAAITRMVQSHETKTLKGYNTSQLTGIIAADVYLDSARQMLSGIAAADPLAAHALCLLAKSYRQRTGESPIALATSVHIMRAAVSASPTDRQLVTEFASVLQQANMMDEARMQQSNAAQLPSTNVQSSPFESEGVIAVVTGNAPIKAGGQSDQAVRIEQISPEAFAMVSKVEAGPTAPPAASIANSTSDTATKKNAAATEPQDPNESEGNVVSRAFKTMTRVWR